MNPQQNFVPNEEQALRIREAMRPAALPTIDPEMVRNVASTLAARRPRRSRRHSGFRARLASWLRAAADWLNPLEG